MCARFSTCQPDARINVNHLLVGGIGTLSAFRYEIRVSGQNVCMELPFCPGFIWVAGVYTCFKSMFGGSSREFLQRDVETQKPVEFGPPAVGAGLQEY